MTDKMRKTISLIVTILIFTTAFVFAEEIKFATIIPRPAETLRGKHLAIGETYRNKLEGSFTCYEGDPYDLDMVVEGNVGIGTKTPQAPLHIVGPSSTATPRYGIYIEPTAPTAASNVQGIYVMPMLSGGSSNTLYGIYVNPIMTNANYSTLYGVYSNPCVTGSGSGTGAAGGGAGVTCINGTSNTVYGIYVDSSNVTAGNIAYSAVFMGGDVNIRSHSYVGSSWGKYRLSLTNDSAGKPNGGSWANASDIRVKKDIKDIDNPLELMLKLRGRQFEWANPEEHGNLKTPRLGFIAQEAEKVFPYWFSEVEPQGKDKKIVKEGKIKSIGIFGFEALTVESIRRLKAKNDALKTENTRLEVRIKRLQSKIAK